MAVAYKWAENARMGADAQAVGEAVERLASRHGGVVPKEVFWREAQKKNHPAHGLFEWNVQKAAEAHWNDQARKILRTLVVVVKEQEAPAYVKVEITDADGRSHEGFMRTDKAMGAPDAKAKVLADAIRQLRGLQRRYSVLSDTLQPIWDALDQIDPPKSA